MPIEVRQLVIRSTVDTPAPAAARGCCGQTPEQQQKQQIKQEALAEFRNWLLQHAADQRER